MRGYHLMGFDTAYTLCHDVFSLIPPRVEERNAPCSSDEDDDHDE